MVRTCILSLSFGTVASEVYKQRKANEYIKEFL